MLRRTVILPLLAVVFVAAQSVPANAAKDEVYTSGLIGKLAVSGYDAVAYFSEGKPVEGSGDFEHEWNGASWRFVSAENLAKFKADPEVFAPQYGGYCAWAVSQGYTASTDPTAWRIVAGKLYLNYSHGVQARWEADIPGNVKKADANWPGVLN